MLVRSESTNGGLSVAGCNTADGHAVTDSCTTVVGELLSIEWWRAGWLSRCGSFASTRGVSPTS